MLMEHTFSIWALAAAAAGKRDRSKYKGSFCGQRTYLEKEIGYRMWQDLIVCGVTSY